MKRSICCIALIAALSTATAQAPSSATGTSPTGTSPTGSKEAEPRPVPGQADRATSPESPGETAGKVIGDLSAPPTDDEVLDALDAQIQSGEHRTAEVLLTARVRSIEKSNHRYHPSLIRPLKLLGDAQMLDGKYGEALDSYGRAVHIDRVSHGLHSPKQIDVVYSEAEAYLKLGNYEQANSKFEYAYEVTRRQHDPYDLELLDGTYRLAEWYVSTYNILPARQLYARALRILEANQLDQELDAIRALRGLANTYRLERFPPMYVSEGDTRDDLSGPTAGLARSADDFRAETYSINSFPAGEKALNSVVRIRQSQVDDPIAVAEAITELGDWYLLFGYPRRATPLYQHARELLDNAGQATLAEQFDRPQLLYFPAPDDPRAPSPSKRGESQQGWVELAFTVSKEGSVRNLKTAQSVPEGLMDFRVRRSMRIAKFRPALVEGEAVLYEGQTYRHNYTYFPRAGAPAGAEAAAVELANADLPLADPDAAPRSVEPAIGGSQVEAQLEQQISEDESRLQERLDQEATQKVEEDTEDHTGDSASIQDSFRFGPVASVIRLNLWRHHG